MTLKNSYFIEFWGFVSAPDHDLLLLTHLRTSFQVLHFLLVKIGHHVVTAYLQCGQIAPNLRF